MDISTQTLMQTFYDVIYDSLTTPPPIPGAVAPLDATKNFLTMSFPGIPIDPAQFANPWSPLNPGGMMSASESFALLVDGAPALSPVYTTNGQSVDTLYGQVVSANVDTSSPALILRATVVKPTPRAVPKMTPLEARKKELAASPPAYRKAFEFLYSPGKDFDGKKQVIDVFARSAKYAQHLDKREKYAATSAQFMAGLLLKQGSRQKPKPAAAAPPPALKASLVALNNPDGRAVEAALKARNSEPRSSVVSIFDAAASLYELTTQGSILVPGLEWHWCEAFPANWFSDAAAPYFASVNIDRENTYTNEESRLGTSPQFDELVEGLFARKGGQSWSREAVSKTTEKLSVSFKFMRVEIRRRWLDPSLFSLAGWAMPGRPKNALSNGALTANPGLLPVIPTSMIVVRDVKISAQWSHEDKSMIQEGVAGEEVAFGPFPLGGLYKQRGLQKQLKSQFDGTTITVPGLQILGFICSLVPACPPRDG